MFHANPGDARLGEIAQATHLQGAKIALLVEGNLIAYLREDSPEIPNPSEWDLPGGIREYGETALECALRETQEEFGISVPPEAIFFASTYDAPAGGFLPDRCVAFFAAHLPHELIDDIVFGDEGQMWRMMPVAEFVSRQDGVLELQTAVAEVVSASGDDGDV